MKYEIPGATITRDDEDIKIDLYNEEKFEEHFKKTKIEVIEELRKADQDRLVPAALVIDKLTYFTFYTFMRIYEHSDHFNKPRVLFGYQVFIDRDTDEHLIKFVFNTDFF